MVMKIQAIFSFIITDGPNGKTGQWLCDLKNGNGSVKYNTLSGK